MLRKTSMLLLISATVVSLGLWMASYAWFVVERIEWRPQSAAIIIAARGRVEVCCWSPSGGLLNDRILTEFFQKVAEDSSRDLWATWEWALWFLRAGATGTEHQPLVGHLEWARWKRGNPSAGGVVCTRLRLPLWLVAMVFAAVPCTAFVHKRVRRHRRRKRNLCIHCGYNLTGLPEPRCPECGEGI